MKKFAVIIIFFYVIGIFVCAESAENNDVTELMNEYSSLYGAEIADGISNLENAELDKLIPGFDAAEMLSGLVQGEKYFSVESILEKGLSILFGEIRNTVRMLVLIMVIAILCTYLTNIQSNLNSKGAVNAAFFVCYLVVSGISAAALMEVVGCGKNLISNISVFMRLMVPVLMVSLVSGGAPVSATSFELVMLGIIEVAEWIIESFFMPMLMIAAALGLINNLSDSINAEKLVQFINKSIKWGIGIVMTVFVGVMNLQGIVSGSVDVLALKVTKFATSNFIPVVGGALSETVETVINCGVVIKNSVGVLGIIIIVFMAAIPVLKIAACLIMFRLCAAVLQPISDKRIVKSLSDISDSVSGMLGLTVVVTVMFIIMLTIIINIAS